MATRSYGTGRIFKRGGRWWISYCVDGVERRESCGLHVKTKGEAQKVLRERMRAVDMGFAPSSTTVGDLLDLFVQDQRNRQRKSLKDAEARAKRIGQALGHLRTSEVSAKHVARFVEKMKSDGASGATVNRYRSVWQRAFRLGVDAGLHVSPAYWPRHAESAPKRDYVTLDRFETVLAELKEPYRTVALAAFWTACRQGEIRKWRWEFVDLEARTVLLPDTKSGTPRQIPLAEPIWAAVYRLSMLRERDWPECPWVFTLDGRTELSIWAMDSAWARACERAGEKIRFHGLRHTAITNFRNAGVEEGSIMAISGHKTRAVFDRYGIQPQELLRTATNRLEKAIRTKFGQPQVSAPSRRANEKPQATDSLVLGGGGPCWIRTSDQRIMSPQL